MEFVGAWGGLTMSLIAFSIVFLVIAGLMVMMMILKLASSSAAAGIAPSVKGAAAPAPARVSQTTKAVTSPHGDDELIAVITAAISASLGTGVRVLSYTPISQRGSSAWRFNGRIGNLEGFSD
ncbi:MAG: OadG family protein [Synergistaceae bacterium]|jgi:hypothetical protein|nr:OadG family protein [Synergistaceae bacterium]